MFTNKTILAPTDFHEKAAKAQEYALEVAARTKSQLYFLHAVEEPYDFATRVEETVEAYTEAAEEKFEELLETARNDERYADLSTYYSIRRGRPYSTIMNASNELNADLIVMGTKGASSIKRILFGDITSNVILDSDVPVLTVPENSKKPYLDRIVFTTDYRDRDLVSLERTAQLAKAFDASLQIIHVDETDSIDTEIRFRGFKSLVSEKIEFDNIEFKLIKSERFSKGISEYVKEHPVSLLVITRYKKLFLKTLLWANNTQELTYYTHVPMLVMTPPGNK